jgi:hypothetical protein
MEGKMADEIILYEDEKEKDTYRINPIAEIVVFTEYEKVDFKTYGYDWLESSRYSLSFKHIRKVAKHLDNPL